MDDDPEVMNAVDDEDVDDADDDDLEELEESVQKDTRAGAHQEGAAGLR